MTGRLTTKILQWKRVDVLKKKTVAFLFEFNAERRNISLIKNIGFPPKS
jgi:hypothetical protein